MASGDHSARTIEHHDLHEINGPHTLVNKGRQAISMCSKSRSNGCDLETFAETAGDTDNGSPSRLSRRICLVQLTGSRLLSPARYGETVTPHGIRKIRPCREWVTPHWEPRRVHPGPADQIEKRPASQLTWP
jgi:hypothetical protein